MPNTRRHRRFIAETILTATAAAMAMLTAVWPDWIEGLTGFDPDQHSGTVEVALVITLTLIAALCLVAALTDRRALKRSPPEPTSPTG